MSLKLLESFREIFPNEINFILKLLKAPKNFFWKGKGGGGGGGGMLF
jgi:hypothetical protein